MNRTKRAHIETWVREQIAKIESDERYHYAPTINAPLAVIQAAMKAKMEVLRKVLVFLSEPGNRERRRMRASS